MKKRRHMIPLAVLVGVLLFAIGVCLWTLYKPNTERKSYQVSVILTDSGSGMWTNMLNGMRAAASEMDVTLNVVETTVGMTLEEEKSLVEQELEDGADGIILDLWEEDAGYGYLSDLSEKTDVVLIHASEEDKDLKWGSVSEQDYEMGRAIGEKIKKVNSMTVHVGIMAGDQSLGYMQERLEGLESVLDEYLDDRPVWIMEKDETSLEALTSRNGVSRADVIIALDNASLETAAAYYASNGNPSLEIIGIGTSRTNIYAMDQGQILTMVVPHGFEAGYMAVKDVMRQLVENEGCEVFENGFTAVDASDMYTNENQSLLFPVG